jgi:hypothetical protein
MSRTTASAFLILLAFQLTPASFKTMARVTVDRTVLSLVSGVATIEPRVGAPGYRWLRVHFYSYPLTPADAAAAAKGNIDALEGRWRAMSGTPGEYNVSHAVLQLGVDKDGKVWQVDLSVPGHACTVAATDKEAGAMLQEYQFDGTRLRLRAKGSFTCQMNSPGVPNPRFGWDVDLAVPVFALGGPGRL